jgi:hypothetical protein
VSWSLLRQTKGGERFALHLAMLPGTSRRALLLSNEVEGRQGKKGVRGGTKTVSDKAALLLPVRQKSMKATSSMKLGDSSPLKGRKTFAAQAFRDVVAVAPRTLSMRVQRRGLLEDQSEVRMICPSRNPVYKLIYLSRLPTFRFIVKRQRKVNVTVVVVLLRVMVGTRDCSCRRRSPTRKRYRLT